MKRILFVSHTNRLPNRFLAFIEYFQHNYELFLITWDRYAKSRDNFPAVPRIPVKAPSSTKGLLTFSRRLLEVGEKIDFDLIYFYDFRLLPAVKILAKRKKAALVYDSMERPTVQVAQKIYSRVKIINFNLLLRLLNVVERRLMGMSDGVLVVDSKEDEFIRSARLAQANSECIMNFPSKHLLPDERSLKHFTEEFKGRNIIAYAGGIHTERGVKKYIDLVARLKEVAPETLLILVGELRQKEDLNSLHAYIKDVGAEGHVRIMGWLNYPNLLALLQLARVGLFLSNPNYYYFQILSVGNGRKPFTYLQAGVPVVTSLEAVGEFLEKRGVGIYVPFHDDDSTFKAVLELLDNDNLYRQLRQRAINLVQRECNWENEMHKAEQVFYRATAIAQQKYA